MNPVDAFLKRTIDLTVSSATLTVLALPLAAVAIAIKLESKGPVFYRGERVGQHGHPFRLFKFRSMRTDMTGGTSTSEDDPRITRVGKFVRKYKLDEFPQFINVFLGDMSLVGPRPQVAWAVAQYTEEQKKVLSLKPGITDFASIRFHNEGEIIAASGIADADEAYMLLIHPEKMRLQLEYLRTRSTLVDLKILWETFSTLWKTRAPSVVVPAAHSGHLNGKSHYVAVA